MIELLTSLRRRLLAWRMNRAVRRWVSNDSDENYERARKLYDAFSSRYLQP